ncbi:hypothetical protein GF351_06400 [Candidatus Woesearchaeota archaeon]|nr:hypothetical protein [Candidatus Woesearchaeota archaeon]
MATPLDIGLLQNFSIIFPFLLVVIVVFGILSYSKLFGENAVVHGVIAIVLGVMVLFSGIAVKTINRMAPWFVLVFIFFMFLMIAYMMFGTSQAEVASWITSPGGFYLILTVVLIIGIGSLASVYFEQEESLPGDDAEAGEAESDFWNTIFHPKVLGMALILLIGLFTIQKLASVTT